MKIRVAITNSRSFNVRQEIMTVDIELDHIGIEKQKTKK